MADSSIDDIIKTTDCTYFRQQVFGMKPQEILPITHTNIVTRQLCIHLWRRASRLAPGSRPERRTQSTQFEHPGISRSSRGNILGAVPYRPHPPLLLVIHGFVHSLQKCNRYTVYRHSQDAWLQLRWRSNGRSVGGVCTPDAEDSKRTN